MRTGAHPAGGPRCIVRGVEKSGVVPHGRTANAVRSTRIGRCKRLSWVEQPARASAVAWPAASASAHDGISSRTWTAVASHVHRSGRLSLLKRSCGVHRVARYDTTGCDGPFASPWPRALNTPSKSDERSEEWRVDLGPWLREEIIREGNNAVGALQVCGGRFAKLERCNTEAHLPYMATQLH